MSAPPPGDPSWVPPVDTALGEDRARLLVAWLRQHARPAVDDAAQTIRARFPGAAVQVDMCRVAQLAAQVRHAHTEGLYAGNVWVNAGGTITQIAIRVRFDGTVDWYWALGER